MSKFRSLIPLVALGAISYSNANASTAPKKLTAYTDGTGMAKLSVDDGSNSDAGGTEQAAKKDDIDAGQKLQAAAENTGQPGATLDAKADDDKKVDTDVSDAGQVKAIGDPPASDQPQG